jgi:hypothetical protein
MRRNIGDAIGMRRRLADRRLASRASPGPEPGAPRSAHRLPNPAPHPFDTAKAAKIAEDVVRDLYRTQTTLVRGDVKAGRIETICKTPRC